METPVTTGRRAKPLRPRGPGAQVQQAGGPCSPDAWPDPDAVSRPLPGMLSGRVLSANGCCSNPSGNSPAATGGGAGGAATNESQGGRWVRPEESDGQAPEPVEVRDGTERQAPLPMAIRALDRGGWSGPFRDVGPGFADACCCPAQGSRGRSLVRSFARAFRGGRPAGRSGQLGAVQGEAMSRWQPDRAGRAGNNGTSSRSFFLRTQCGPSGGRGAALQS